MDFSSALLLLKAGHRVTRPGLGSQVATVRDGVTIQPAGGVRLWSPQPAPIITPFIFGSPLSKPFFVQEISQIPQPDWLAWVPTVTDLLATDWLDLG